MRQTYEVMNLTTGHRRTVHARSEDEAALFFIKAYEKLIPIARSELTVRKVERCAEKNNPR